MSPIKDLRSLPPGLHNVGIPNLYIQITKNKQTGKIRKSWIYRYKSIFGVTRSMGLGSLKAISLNAAKQLAEEQAKLRQQVKDPLFIRDGNKVLIRNEAQAQKAAQKTLEQATNEFLEANGKHWSDSYIQKWKRMFQQHLYGRLPLLQATSKDHVIAALKPVFKHTPRQAKILQQHLQTVMDWCVHKGYTETNPAKWDGNLEFEFKNTHKTQHMASLPYTQAKQFYQELTRIDTIPAKALRFIMLTAVRAGEALGAKWDEIDLENRVWTIPENRMKMRKEHKVPLSDAAIAVLKELRQQFESHDIVRSDLIFPVSDASLRQLKRTMGYNITIHGLRSTFKTWASEQTDYPNEISELALAHQISNATERAYKRTTLFEKRRALMDQWSDYCSKP